MRSKKTKKGKKEKPSGLLTRISILFLTALILVIVTSMVFRFTMRSEKYQDNVKMAYTRVEVLNGCGVDNLAYKVSLYLREKGFDVVEIANVKETKVERTIIIERIDKGMKNARVLGKAIRCSNMTTMIDSTLLLEVTLILGEDYGKYFPRKVLEKKIY
jgi:hypothetical protein